eukprot:TRINITY_DN10590_c0_g1_i1.p1 TRINITY_DN10590_c0_g1~~TRINITY_DN10590_c0_g1_i1.p1  ORF type:complete len:161 (+),score=7.52 TRINITY_DN10590_c0_g1_i1:87-569(+)
MAHINVIIIVALLLVAFILGIVAITTNDWAIITGQPFNYGLLSCEGFGCSLYNEKFDSYGKANFALSFIGLSFGLSGCFEIIYQMVKGRKPITVMATFCAIIFLIFYSLGWSVWLAGTKHYYHHSYTVGYSFYLGLVTNGLAVAIVVLFALLHRRDHVSL